MNLFYTWLKGVIIGISNAIPGVSGGTMAVVLNIYDKILDSLSIKKWKNNLDFLIPLLIGVGVGIIVLSHVITPLQKNYPIALGFTFIGLIIGSLPLIAKHAFNDIAKPKPINIFLCVFCFLTMIVIASINTHKMEASSIATINEVNIHVAITLVITTALATIAMIIPGISGSLVLLIFGTYTSIMKAIAGMKIGLLFFVSIGAVLGLVLGVSAIKKAMTYFPHSMYFSILGLVAGSIWNVYPGFTYDSQGCIAIVCLVLSAVLSYLSSASSSAK